MKNNQYNVIADFLEYIEDLRLYSPHTVRSYRHDLDEYSDFCQNIEPKKDIINVQRACGATVPCTAGSSD